MAQTEEITSDEALVLLAEHSGQHVVILATTRPDDPQVDGDLVLSVRGQLTLGRDDEPRYARADLIDGMFDVIGELGGRAATIFPFGLDHARTLTPSDDDGEIVGIEYDAGPVVVGVVWGRA